MMPLALGWADAGVAGIVSLFLHWLLSNALGAGLMAGALVCFGLLLWRHKGNSRFRLEQAFGLVALALVALIFLTGLGLVVVPAVRDAWGGDAAPPRSAPVRPAGEDPTDRGAFSNPFPKGADPGWICRDFPNSRRAARIVSA